MGKYEEKNRIKNIILSQRCWKFEAYIMKVSARRNLEGREKNLKKMSCSYTTCEARKAEPIANRGKNWERKN